jgi:hypothetical protein
MVICGKRRILDYQSLIHKDDLRMSKGPGLPDPPISAIIVGFAESTQK